MERRKFFIATGQSVALLLIPGISPGKLSGRDRGQIITVKGSLKPDQMGFTLSHEHVLVDFIGADKYNAGRWNDEEVLDVAIPYIKEILRDGCQTLVECTPEYIGRDPALLKKLSDKTGINILTNTGYYGAADNKYLPDQVYSETAEQLADRWINEFENGIGNTGIRPGFIKIGVAPGPLSKLHKKLITAAGITHLKTGLKIASHTGPSLAAFEQLEVLKIMGISPSAFIWVHAQNEENDEKGLEAAEAGAWVSLDGLNKENTGEYISWIKKFKGRGLLNRVLVSHDAGWYSPGEDNGGDFRPYTDVFNYLVPGLLNEDFREKDIETLFVRNPAEAFMIKVRKQ